MEDDFHGYETAAASGRAAVLGWDLGSGNAVLRVFDVDSAGKPTPVGELDTGLTAGNIQDLEMAVDGSYAVAALGPHGIWVIALVGTGAPRLLGTYDTPGVAMDVVHDSSGSIAFVADGSAGLQIVDITNPAEPHLVGSKRLSGFEKSVAVVEQRAFLVSAGGTLEGVDVSDPANPSLFGYAVAGGIGVHMAGKMTPEGPRLAILVGAGGIHLNIFDATSRNPTLIGTVFVEDARRVAMVGNKALVADVTEGFKIFSIEGGNPILLESDIAPGRAEDVDVHGTTAYVAGFPSSLSVVEIAP